MISEVAKVVYRFTIQGRLTTANEFIAACNTNRNIGGRLKREEETRICYYALKLRGKLLKKVRITFEWHEKDKKRDLDNIAFAKKFILDGLQKISVLENDGWKQIAGFEDKFFIDAKNPRVEVIIEEVL